MITDLKNELSNAKQLTENGAVGYRTTGKRVVRFKFYDKFIKK